MINKFNPFVTIIIPVYNGSNYLSEAIDSALSQTYKNIEIIVVNDGSNDGGKTRDIALSYGDKIRYFEKENGGVATALNLGIREMRGEYFSWLSHDDVYGENKIEEQVNFLRKCGYRKVIVYSDFDIIDENSHYISSTIMPQINSSEFRYWITTESCLHGCTLLIPKICFEECGVFNESLMTTQDYDLWFRIAQKFEFPRIPKILVKSRVHRNQTTRINGYKVIEECNNLRIDFFKQLYSPYNLKDVNTYRIIGAIFYNSRFYRASYFVYTCGYKTLSWKYLNTKYHFLKGMFFSMFKLYLSNKISFN